MIGERSAQQGFKESRLPEFTKEEKRIIAGSADFFGLNHYTTGLAYNTFAPANPATVSYQDDGETGADADYTWPRGDGVYWPYEVLTVLKINYFSFLQTVVFLQCSDF